jgi:hypothetical protein
MDIDLAALPDDVETLQRMVRTLAAHHDIWTTGVRITWCREHRALERRSIYHLRNELHATGFAVTQSKLYWRYSSGEVHQVVYRIASLGCSKAGRRRPTSFANSV